MVQDLGPSARRAARITVAVMGESDQLDDHRDDIAASGLANVLLSRTRLRPERALRAVIGDVSLPYLSENERGR